METNPHPKGIYDDVDKYRYRANWSCIGWVIAMALFILVVLWFFAKRFLPQIFTWF